MLHTNMFIKEGMIEGKKYRHLDFEPSFNNILLGDSG